MKLRRLLFAFTLILIALLIPLTSALTQDGGELFTLEITGVNPTNLPEVIITANVTNIIGQPVVGLGLEHFTLSGELAQHGEIVDVQNLVDDNLPFAVVMVIDTSTSMINAGVVDETRAAAIGFIDALGEDDPVAVMAFSTNVRLVLDYTTDRDALRNAIQNLQFGGQTALYRAGLSAVELAADSPVPRRAVVFISDGSLDDPANDTTRNVPLEEARNRGVSFYTIGLGSSYDRTFLRDIATNTNARFYESPTGDQLAGIYNDIASVLRSQYVITLDVDVPLDGTEYPFTLTVNTDSGSASADGVMRAPIPSPIIRLPDAPTEALTEATTFTVEVLGDDQPLSLTVNGVAVDTLPFTFDVDPLQNPPGDYSIEFVATDADGESTSATFNYAVAALPSQVVITLPEGELSEPTNATIEVFGQTPTTEISFNIDDGESAPVEQVDVAYAALITPFDLAPGEHTLNVTVTNEGGVTSTTSQTFTVAALPPVVVVTGLESGQVVDAPVSVGLDISGQTALGELVVGVMPNDPDRAIQSGIPNEDGGKTLTTSLNIDPYDFPPGPARLSYGISDASGQSASGGVDFAIAELPIELILDGLTESETIAEDRTVSIDFRSQTPVVHVATFVDGAELGHLVEAPFETTISLLDHAPGPHLLRIVADTADGRQATFEVGFIIDPVLAEAATGTAVAGQATLDAANAQATNAAQATIASASANATATALVEQATTDAANAQATNDAISLEATTAAQATNDAAATSSAANQEATLDALATNDALAAQSTQTAADSRATYDARSTIAADAATAAVPTAAALSAAGTSSAQQTRDAFGAQATTDASTSGTSTAAAQQATNDAAATLGADAAAATDAAAQTATAEGQATLDAQGTATAAQQGTSDARETAAAAILTATADAEGTSVAQASIADSTATADAEFAAQTATADALAAVNAEATNSAGTEVALQTATGEAALTQTADAQPTATPTVAETEEPTAEPQVEDVTPTEQPTLIPEVGESAPDTGSNLTIPLIIGCVVLLIILLVVWLLLSGRRGDNQQK